MEKPSAQQHYDYLDGLRALLALFVVVHHAWYTVYDYDRAHLSNDFFLLSYGHYAVAFFIVVSGFCLVLPTLKNDCRLTGTVGNFIKRRAWRILPPYYCALAFSMALDLSVIRAKTGTHWDVALPLNIHNILTHLLLLQNFFSDDISKINHVLWSISLEWQIYFFFPLILLLWRKIGWLPTAIVLLLFSKLAVRVYNYCADIQVQGLGPGFEFLVYFSLGMLAARICFSPGDAMSKYRPLRWDVITPALAVAFLAALYFGSRYDGLVFATFASAFLIFVSIHSESWFRKLLDFQPLVFIGGFSYSLYLIHAPILQLLWQYPLFHLQTQPNLMVLMLIFVGTPVSLLVSYLFFLGCERPFLKQRGRKIVHIQ